MYWIFLLLFVFFVWQIHRNAAYISESLSDYGLKLFLGLVSCIIPTGFVLSKFNLIGQAIAWGISVNLIAVLFYILFRQIANNYHFSLLADASKLKTELINAWGQASAINKLSFALLLIAVVITAVINLIMSFITFPNEWDSMTGHLVKCAYYLQNGNMNRMQGTTWTIDFYPN